MRFSALLILILNTYCVFSQIPHEATYFVGCFENGTSAVQYDFDGEEILYVDFSRKEIVFTVPNFIYAHPDQLIASLSVLKDALNGEKMCQPLMEFVIKEVKPSSEEKDPPDHMIFPSREVEPEEENTLICFVNDFYPPTVKVSWTKNGLPATKGVWISEYSPNSDQTFRMFSTLKFTPTEGDIYSCTVEHPALETPKTRILEIEFNKADPSLWPVVYCGVGVALGILGITVGVFFIVKAQHLN
ncbi:PREDICTED: rano class II histocompatibility antigen, B alpha chain-like [Cyprinodon variegatus]|uniref:rano class II histocompatibility antigen, B alpha chain-like n=1 Tax=Cyprinodon variegatus TaxID=28743 RepID=UPI000742BB35|nr:PREDICTED: rano class II histocompatibility antigen, B alpha chain-like [Cyprinodon variegatus]